MIILLIALVIILLTYILINYSNTNKENFITLYDDINDYLKLNIDDKVLRNSFCFDNDVLLRKLKNNPSINCSTELKTVNNIHLKNLYDNKENRNYSFAEVCPVTTKQLNSTLCLRKHNNDISDTMFRLNNIITDSEIKLKNSLNDIDDELNTYRNDKYRLFNSYIIQDYYNNNKL